MSHSKPRFPARTDVSKPVVAALCADACYDHSVRLVKLIFQKSGEKNEVQGARGISSHHDGRVCSDLVLERWHSFLFQIFDC